MLLAVGGGRCGAVTSIFIYILQTWPGSVTSLPGLYRPWWMVSLKKQWDWVVFKLGVRWHSSAEVASIHKCPDICMFSSNNPFTSGLSVSKWPAHAALPGDPSRVYWAFDKSTDIGSKAQPTILIRNKECFILSLSIWASASGLSVSPLSSFLSVYSTAGTDSVWFSPINDLSSGNSLFTSQQRVCPSKEEKKNLRHPSTLVFNVAKTACDVALYGNWATAVD